MKFMKQNLLNYQHFSNKIFKNIKIKLKNSISYVLYQILKYMKTFKCN